MGSCSQSERKGIQTCIIIIIIIIKQAVKQHVSQK